MFLINQKSKVLLYLIVTLLFITAAPITTVGTEVNPVNFFAEEEENNCITLESINVVDCPENIFDEHLSSRVILQIINNTFHKWKEYDLGENGEFCIFLEEPEWRPLTAEEARELIADSKGWMEQSQQILSLEEATVINPEDLPDRDSLMPYTDEPRPDMVDDHVFDKPNTAIYRSDFLETMSNNILEYNGSISQTERYISIQKVFGIDERERVPYEACISYPWNTIGCIYTHFWNRYSGGTGFLISPYTALTNAHVLYNSDNGGWYHDLSFSPGQYQAYQGGPVYYPYGYQYAASASIPQYYVDYEHSYLSTTFDYGAFFIETPFEGISTFMPLEFNSYPSYVNLAGYPSAAKEETYSMAMWHSHGPVTAVYEHVLCHLASASPGNSGSPVWVYNQQTDCHRVVGLISGGAQYCNAGPRLNYYNKPLIEEWMRWTPTPTTVPVTSVSLNKTNITLTKGATETLIATVSPENATNKSVIWSSSNNSVATVTSNGVVSAVGPGTAVITVRTQDGNKTATCTVTVTQLGTPEISVLLGVERINANTLELTAVSSGGTNVEYRFDMRVMGSNNFTTIREYSINPNFTWTGANDGAIYEIVVHADAHDADYSAYYVVFGNTDASQIVPFTGLNLEVTSVGNEVHVQAIPQGGTNVIYALVYKEAGGEFTTLDPSNPYQASPNFVRVLPHGNYEIVVHAIEMAAGRLTYKGGWVAVTIEEDDVVELEINDVRAITVNNQWLRVGFSRPVSDINPGDINIRNLETDALRVVETVTMAKGGMAAYIKVLQGDDSDAPGLRAGVRYNMSLLVNGQSLSQEFVLLSY